MARYRWISDGHVNNTYYHAGDIFTAADDWIPPAAVDPLDAAAVSAFYAAGPQIRPLVRQQWTTRAVNPPVTYWQRASGNFWELTGLGAGLAPISV